LRRSLLILVQPLDGQMITERLIRIFSLFERIESLGKFGREFERYGGEAPDFLPLEYRIFTSAERRILPSDWELYSFFGHHQVTLDVINDQLRSAGLPPEFVVFGKTGDEDFLLFNDKAVYWCDANSVLEVSSTEPFAQSFSKAILKIIQLRIGELSRTLNEFDNEYCALHVDG
jgi:hypothetical protein